jgi:hypothetical protein
MSNVPSLGCLNTLCCPLFIEVNAVIRCTDVTVLIGLIDSRGVPVYRVLCYEARAGGIDIFIAYERMRSDVHYI